jgi:putative ABC transport system permease protein
VKDFNTNSLQKPIVPIVMGCWKATYGMAGIKLRAGAAGRSGEAGGSGDVAPTLAAIERIWRAAYPDYVYSYQFLDDKIAGYYKEEGKLSELYRMFAGIAIFISCLGLYGLVSFMAVQRTKEIGVRKVLGASVTDMMVLLSKEFTVLIGVAFVVAGPVAWLLTRRWLEGFAYRIRPGAGTFLSAVALSVIIAWVTVGYRTYRASVANPARALRSE